MLWWEWTKGSRITHPPTSLALSATGATLPFLISSCAPSPRAPRSCDRRGRYRKG